MSCYQWRGYELRFNNKEEEHQKITQLFTKHTNQVKQVFKRKYKSGVKGYDDRAIKAMCEVAWEVFDEELLDLKKDIQNEDSSMGIDEICLTYQEETFQLINTVQIELLKVFYQLKEFQDQKKDYRQLRKDNRSYWSGGGFGIQGAIKGAVEASILNIATGAAHSTVNAIGNLGTAVNTNLKASKLINEYGYDAMIQAIMIGFSNIYHACLKIKGLDQLYTDAMLSKNECILKQYQEEIDAPADKYLFDNIKNNPYNLKQYEVIIENYGDENEVLEEIGMACGLDIGRLKEKLFRKECEQLPKKTDRKTLEDNYTFILEKKKLLGFNRALSLEVETKRKLDQELSIELKRVLERTDQENKESILDAMNAVKRIQAKFNYGDDFYKELQSHLENVETKERTVEGTIYGSKNEADEVKKLYVGNIKHNTLKDAELSRKEEKKITEIENSTRKQDGFDLIDLLNLYKNLEVAPLSSLYFKDYIASLKKTIVQDYRIKSNFLNSRRGNLSKSTLFNILGVIVIPFIISGLLAGIIPGIIPLIIAVKLFSKAKEYKDLGQGVKEVQEILTKVKLIANINIDTGDILFKNNFVQRN
jgi:hypothetical protein